MKEPQQLELFPAPPEETTDDAEEGKYRLRGRGYDLTLAAIAFDGKLRAQWKLAKRSNARKKNRKRNK